MNQSWLQIFAVAAIVLGVAAILFDVVVHRLHKRALRRHSSRFPMFAIRDELVRLVACGNISEDSLAWQRMYRSVNSVLDMHQRLDVVDVLHSLVGYRIALRQDPALRKAAERFARETESEVARNPQFKRVIDKMDDAFFELVSERSWPLPRFRLRLAPWRLRLSLFVHLLFRGFDRRATREISQQGARQLPGWQQWHDAEGLRAA